MPDQVDPLEVLRLDAAATPGPWNAERRWINDCEIIPRITCARDADRGCGWVADLIGAPYLGHVTTLPNAYLIAAFRTAAPELARRVIDQDAKLSGYEDAFNDQHAEIDRLRKLLVAEVLCGFCGKEYSYNRADDPHGEKASDAHDVTCEWHIRNVQNRKGSL